MTSVYRRAGFLRFAAIQFVVLTVCAMIAYTGGTWFDPTTRHYELTGNFLSDLGATRSLSGATNYVSSALFFVALATCGAALIAFAWTWRGFAYERGLARFAGYTSAVLGTASGLAFIGVAVTPWNLVLDVHNAFVVGAFGLLMLYVAAITIVMWRNGIGGVRLAINLVYLVVIAGYVALVVHGPRFNTEHGHRVQVIGQKIVAYVSMLHIMFLTSTTRRAELEKIV
ncbi:MAG: hypothetical protein ABI591_23515 [Kofleriaceae bacterium]